MNYFMPPRMPTPGLGMQQFQLPGQLASRPVAPNHMPLGGFGGGFEGSPWGSYGGQQMPKPFGGFGGYGGGVPLSGLRRGMASYKNGTPYVPRTGPAILHEGEAVIPAAKAKKMRKVPLSSLLRLK